MLQSTKKYPVEPAAPGVPIIFAHIIELSPISHHSDTIWWHIATSPRSHVEYYCATQYNVSRSDDDWYIVKKRIWRSSVGNVHGTHASIMLIRGRKSIFALITCQKAQTDATYEPSQTYACSAECLTSCKLLSTWDIEAALLFVHQPVLLW